MTEERRVLKACERAGVDPREVRLPGVGGAAAVDGDGEKATEGVEGWDEAAWAMGVLPGGGIVDVLGGVQVPRGLAVRAMKVGEMGDKGAGGGKAKEGGVKEDTLEADKMDVVDG